MQQAKNCFVILQSENPTPKKKYFLRMEEQQRLPDMGSRCGTLLPPNGCEGSDMISGFLERFMSVVASRGDLGYAEQVAQDALLVTAEMKDAELTFRMSQLQLSLRQQLVAERKQEKLMAMPKKLGDQVNVLTGVAAQALLTEKSADK